MAVVSPQGNSLGANAASVRPSRWRLTYALELLAVEGSKAANRVLGLPLNPEAVTYAPHAATEVSPTVGGVAVEQSGFILTDIEVKGTAGLATKRGWSAGTLEAAGDLIQADGNRLHEELRRFFSIYDFLMSQPETNYRFILAWHDHIQGRHYMVVPTSGFVVRRDAAQHRRHRAFEFRLQAVADYHAARRAFFDDGVLATIRRGVGRAIDAVRMISGYVEDARAFVAEAEAFVVGPLRAALAAADELVAAGTALVEGTLQFMAAPLGAARAWVDAIDRWGVALEAALERGWDNVEAAADALLAQRDLQQSMAAEAAGLLAQPDIWAQGVDDREADMAALRLGPAAQVAADEATARPTSTLARGLEGDSARRVVEAARAGEAERVDPVTGRTLPARRWTGVRRYLVRAGDTLVGIATRELGSPSEWEAILRANPDLRAPYISLAGLPATVRPGDYLLVPSADTAELGAASGGPGLAQDPERALLGVDFALDAEGEWTADGERVGVRLIGGFDNYVQGVGRIRLATELGENLLYPHVGMARPIGERAGQAQLESVAVSARAAVAQDPRTAEIQPTEVDAADGRLDIVLRARPRGSTGWRALRQPVR